MSRFYIVAHTHWDREWHKTYQENRVRLIRFMDDLLETLENDEDFSCFVLDGQTSLIGDYLDVKPEQQERLRSLIASGRIAIGPWFVQPDENLPGVEGIIRNLLISKSISEEFGSTMRVGYLPDSFGQSAAMPAILRGFGIDCALFYRGFAEEDCPNNDFIWRSPDGSEVIASWMPVGYGNGMFLSSDLDKSIKEIEGNIARLAARSICGNLLLMCGSDQCFSKKFLPDICRRLTEYYRANGYDHEFLLATPEDYMESLKPYRDQMKTLNGELRKGKRSRVHISIGATRMDIKQANWRIEHKYQNLLEPLSVLASITGDDNDMELIRRGWKYIVENHAHDSICCCCNDTIHKEMLSRIEAANQIANLLISEKFNSIHRMIRYNRNLGRPIIIFSSYASDRNDLVRTDIYVKNPVFALTDDLGTEVYYSILNRGTINLKDTKVGLTPLPDDFYEKITIEFYAAIDGAGYRTFYIKEGTPPTLTQQTMARQKGLENKFLRVETTDVGTLCIIDKTTGRVFDNQHIFVDSGNAGDEYDYSPSRNDFEIRSSGCMTDVQVTVDTPLKAALKLSYTLNVPESTDNDNRSEKTVRLDIETQVELRHDDPQVYFTTTVKNNAKNHRVQVEFDLGENAATHFADVQLGELERANELPETSESQNSWSERYYPIYNQHKYCGVCADDKKRLCHTGKRASAIRSA